MAFFTIRVVLHAATAKNYADLHARMINAGASRTIRGDDGVVYDLPDGEYDLVSGLDAGSVMRAVADIARGVKAVPDPSVLVTEAKSRAWRLRPVPGQS